MSQSIAFIGVGNMGCPMAENLMKAGKSVKVFDVSKKMLGIAKDKNLETAENLDDLITDHVETVITMLPEGKHSKEVYLGDNGIINKVSKNCLLIDCSTIDIQTSIKIGKKASEKGVEMIDAPVSGGVMGAQKATLNIMVGGSKEAFEKALPLLKIMGKNIFHAGDLGSGNGAKICNNMALGIAMIAASESLMLAKRLNTPSNNNYRPGFSAGMMNKDLKLANDCAKSVNAETPLGKMALEIYDQFCKEGNDTKDFSAISKVIGGNAWDYPID